MDKKELIKKSFDKIKELLSNKLFFKFFVFFLLFIALLISNMIIENNIYKSNDRSFFAITYAKIMNMPAIKINGNKVSYVDYFKFYDYLNNFYKKQNENENNNTTINPEAIKNEVTSKLIKNSILETLSLKYNIKPTDREVFDEIKNLDYETGSIDDTAKIIKDTYNMSLDEFKKNFIEPIIIKNKLDTIISNDPIINKDKIEKITNIYNQIKASNNAVTKNKLGQEIDMFSTLAKEFSEDKTSSEEYGDLGWLSRDSMEESIKNAAFALKDGEYSGVIKSSNGYHIIKLLDKIDTIDIPKVRIAHIFVKSMDINTYLKQEIDSAKIKIYIK